jgi:hypothetical protein
MVAILGAFSSALTFQFPRASRATRSAPRFLIALVHGAAWYAQRERRALGASDFKAAGEVAICIEICLLLSQT